MPHRRLLALLELLSPDGDDEENSFTLCGAVAAFTQLSGAGIVLSSPGPHYTRFCASDETALQLLETEIALGEGPGRDACRTNFASDVPDLYQDNGRWLAYARAAVEHGARAVFGFPVTIGAIRVGALVLYRDEPGPLSDLQESDAYLAASVAGRAILNWRAGAPSGTLADELGLTLSFDFSVHQAAGMVAVQANLDLSDAMVLLRAHAIGSGVAMTDLSKRVVARAIAYDDASATWREVEAPDL